MNEDTTHRLFREAAAQTWPVRPRRKPPAPPTETFEQWWGSNHEAAAWDKTWANVSVVKEIARKAWADGYTQGAQDTW